MNPYHREGRDGPDFQPYSMLEVVPGIDDKMVVEDANDYSTLEVIYSPSNEKIATHDFANFAQDYSTLEVRQDAYYPPKSARSVPSLRAPRSPIARSVSPLLDQPLPPLPGQKQDEQYLRSKASIRTMRTMQSQVTQRRMIKECGVWYDRMFYAGEGGMEIRMSRNSTIFRDMQWEVICGTSRVLGVKGNPNSWSEKRSFTDQRGNLIFKTRKNGSKGRVAESGNQIVFLMCKDPDSGVSAAWTVDFQNARDKRAMRWNVRGSASTRDVYINCYGVPIGRISRPDTGSKELFKEKHTYILKVKPGIDYTILVAIVVAYDDFRIEGGSAM